MNSKKSFRILVLEVLGPVKQAFRRWYLKCLGYKNIHWTVVLERGLNLDRVDPKGVIIKAHCLIASGVTILCHEHVYRDPNNDALPLLKPVTIGERTFVGVGATILPGVTVGEDCIIGAGSVVTKDLPRGSLAVGVPARIIRAGLRMNNEAVLIDMVDPGIDEEPAL
jgi:serine acetyltransferase